MKRLLALLVLCASSSFAEEAPALLSFQDYMEWVLYQPKIGFYTSGRIKIDAPQRGGDYLTFPTGLSPEFGQLLAETAYRTWRQMRLENRIGPDERFDVVELGSGNGQLAEDFLTYARRQSKETPLWESFWKNLSYTSVDISSEAVKTQTKRLDDFSNATVRWGDARALHQLWPAHSKKGLVFANELLDNLSAERARLTQALHFEVAKVVPCLPAAAASPAWKKDDAWLRKRYPNRFSVARVCLSRQAFREWDAQLPDAYEDALAQIDSIEWVEVFEPLSRRRDLLPALKETLPAFADWMARNQKDVWFYPQPGAWQMLESVHQTFQDGYVLLMDYGHDSGTLLDPSLCPSGSRLRMFGPFPELVANPNPYSKPTRMDVTVDVAFSPVATRAKELGWTLQLYGNQGRLLDGLSGYRDRLVKEAKKGKEASPNRHTLIQILVRRSNESNPAKLIFFSLRPSTWPWSAEASLPLFKKESELGPKARTVLRVLKRDLAR